jgi:hypothetical protein
MSLEKRDLLMKNIRDLVGQELKWSQPHQLKREYELHAGNELVATLRFRSLFGSFATAESGDGCWTFKRVGFWQTSVTIRSHGSDQDIAVFKNNTWTNGGTLELPNGCHYPANTHFWMTTYEFTTEAGQSLVQYRRIGGILSASSLVTIQPSAAALGELPWLVMLGWYLRVMLDMDAAMVAIVVTVVIAGA